MLCVEPYQLLLVPKIVHDSFSIPSTCTAIFALLGIGKRTALHLARMGAKVIMACRSVQKGEDARAELEQEIRRERISVHE